MSDFLIHEMAKDRQRAVTADASDAAAVRQSRKDRRAARRRSKG
jgi:hypothetical protein